ncbi:MAG: methyltransferase domain-containing protein [Patescibacteria group bacterium]|nr:methyltransferase domain-containing protein [Patescibacteria group bacterium]
MTYFLILGNNPTLSIAEILKILTGPFEIKKISEEVLIIDLPGNKEIDFAYLQNRLGGTIKIGKILPNQDLKNLADLFSEKSAKVRFGFSVYRLDHQASISQIVNLIKNLALNLKKDLKEKGISSRWVTSREDALSSVIVQTNKLLETGAEFVFFAEKNGFLFGRTLTCQDFKEYGFRDFGRPNRSMEQGILPPKLAKIMINLAGELDKKAVILDPFCGAGTILQEAALMGYKNIIGADLNPEAIKDTQQNLDWLIKNSKFQSASWRTKFQIFQTDVKEISKKIDPQSIDLIVAEPYLGPTKISSLKAQLLIIMSKLSDLYIGAFKEFQKILKPNGQVVMIFPIYQDLKQNNGIFSEFILPEIDKMGWQTVNILPDSVASYPIIKSTKRQSIIYARANQEVWREIFIFSLGKK